MTEPQSVGELILHELNRLDDAADFSRLDDTPCPIGIKASTFSGFIWNGKRLSLQTGCPVFEKLKQLLLENNFEEARKIVGQLPPESKETIVQSKA